MLCSTTDPNLRTRDHPVLMSQLLEVGLDPGRDDPTLDRLRLLDQAEVEEVHYSDFHFRRQQRACIQR